jgi:hypothetical protein
MKAVMAWTWFVVVQLISLVATVLGWLVLIPACLAQAWALGATSIKDGRAIDRWKWKWLWPYQNPEDGVSGQTALIWVNGRLAPYMPGAHPAWRAYCWSAWRNSADSLKYAFAWEQGPYTTFQLFGRTVHAGWKNENGRRVPVLS